MTSLCKKYVIILIHWFGETTRPVGVVDDGQEHVEQDEETGEDVEDEKPGS